MEAFFLQGPAGPIFGVFHPPRDRREAAALVVHCPAFAEEMNKSRRMVALQARAWAERGVGTLVIDLFGTGDSQGDFADATWDIWLGDVAAAVAWARARCDRIWLWGLRGGALLAAALAGRSDARLGRLVLWQPVLKGDVWLTQFLRLRTAAALFRGDGKETVKEIRARLASGERLEVAGYTMSPELAAGLAVQDLGGMLARCASPVSWLEVLGQVDGGLAPGSSHVVEALQASGVAVDVCTVTGESFWATQEIATAPELLAATPFA